MDLCVRSQCHSLKFGTARPNLLQEAQTATDCLEWLQTGNAVTEGEKHLFLTIKKPFDKGLEGGSQADNNKLIRKQKENMGSEHYLILEC